jgi:hypothetical protein
LDAQHRFDSCGRSLTLKQHNIMKNYETIAERAGEAMGHSSFVNDSTDKRGGIMVRNISPCDVQRMDKVLKPHRMSVSVIEPAMWEGEPMVRVLFW